MSGQVNYASFDLTCILTPLFTCLVPVHSSNHGYNLLLIILIQQLFQMVMFSPLKWSPNNFLKKATPSPFQGIKAQEMKFWHGKQYKLLIVTTIIFYHQMPNISNQVFNIGQLFTLYCSAIDNCHSESLSLNFHPKTFSILIITNLGYDILLPSTIMISSQVKVYMKYNY